jgi:ketosteroid isomerase-like protein
MLLKRATSFFAMFLCAVFFAAPALAADESDLAGRAATWEKEYNEGNLGMVAVLYSQDACRMPPNRDPINGPVGILALLKFQKDQGAAKVKVTVTTAETSGELGYGAGTYEITRADGSHFDHGKWMNVSKKIDGKWKIVCDIWNSNMPLPAAPK